jgi:hypothetical protein
LRGTIKLIVDKEKEESAADEARENMRRMGRLEF